MNADHKSCSCLGLRTVLLCSVAAVAVVVLLIAQGGTDHFAIDGAPPPASAPSTGAALMPPVSVAASPDPGQTVAAYER